jgi:hypothetical protein
MSLVTYLTISDQSTFHCRFPNPQLQNPNRGIVPPARTQRKRYEEVSNPSSLHVIRINFDHWYITRELSTSRCCVYPMFRHLRLQSFRATHKFTNTQICRCNQGCHKGRFWMKITIRTSARVCVYSADAVLPADGFLPSADAGPRTRGRADARGHASCGHRSVRTHVHGGQNF